LKINLKMKNKKFTFEISINAVPYNEETCKEIYGLGYNSDIPEEAHARELVSTVLNDAYCERLMAETAHFVECKCDSKDMDESQLRYHQYLKQKTRVAKAVLDSCKFVRSQEI